MSAAAEKTVAVQGPGGSASQTTTVTKTGETQPPYDPNDPTRPRPKYKPSGTETAGVLGKALNQLVLLREQASKIPPEPPNKLQLEELDKLTFDLELHIEAISAEGTGGAPKPINPPSHTTLPAKA